MSPNRVSYRVAVVFALVALAWFAPPTQAQTFTWQNATGSWSLGSNWVGGTAPPPGGGAGVTLRFVADTSIDMLAMHLASAPPQPRDLWAEIPRPLEQLLLRMLDKDANGRPTLEEVKSVLLSVRAAPQPRPSQIMPAVARPDPRRLLPFVAVAVGALALGAAVAFRMMERKPAPPPPPTQPVAAAPENKPAPASPAPSWPTPRKPATSASRAPPAPIASSASAARPRGSRSRTTATRPERSPRRCRRRRSCPSSRLRVSRHRERTKRGIVSARFAMVSARFAMVSGHLAAP